MVTLGGLQDDVWGSLGQAIVLHRRRWHDMYFVACVGSGSPASTRRKHEQVTAYYTSR